MEEVKQNISYANLTDLATALTTAVGGMLMSLEDAKFIWKRHLYQVGWKNKPPTEVVPEITPKAAATKVGKK